MSNKQQPQVLSRQSQYCCYTWVLKWAKTSFFFLELEWIHVVLYLIRLHLCMTMNDLRGLHICWIMNDPCLCQRTISLWKGIFIFAQRAKNLLNYASLSEFSLGIVVSPTPQKKCCVDILRNCLCIKLKLAVVIILDVMRLGADNVIRNNSCIKIVFSPLFTAKCAFYLKRKGGGGRRWNHDKGIKKDVTSSYFKKRKCLWK